MCNFPRIPDAHGRAKVQEARSKRTRPLGPVKAIWGRTRFHCRKSDLAGTFGKTLQHLQDTLLLSGEAAVENPPQSAHSLLGEHRAERPAPPVRVKMERRFQNVMVLFVQHRSLLQIRGKARASSFNPGDFHCKPVSPRLLCRDRQHEQVGTPGLADCNCDNRGRARFAAIFRTSLMLTTPKIFAGPNVPLLGRRHCGNSSVWPVHAASSISRCSAGISSTT